MIDTRDAEMVKRVLADGCRVFVVTCDWSTTRVIIAPDEDKARDEAVAMFLDSLISVDDPVAKVTMVTSRRAGRRVLRESKDYEAKHWLDEGEDVIVYSGDEFEDLYGDIPFDDVLAFLPVKNQPGTEVSS